MTVGDSLCNSVDVLNSGMSFFIGAVFRFLASLG